MERCLIFLLLVNAIYRFSCDTQLETDCSGPKSDNPLPALPAITVAFRNDNITQAERDATFLMMCGRSSREQCFGHNYDSPYHESYIDLTCVDDHFERSFITRCTEKIQKSSPTRALTVSLRERHDDEDAISSAVFEPVRQRIIDLSVRGASGGSRNLTAKIRDIGALPNLVALEVRGAYGLHIGRSDFNGMPNVQAINFHMATIASLEPHTFTDLPLLESLLLDDALYLLARTERTVDAAHQEKWDQVYRVHCDCSFAWLRNFLRQRPNLTEIREGGQRRTHIGLFPYLIKHGTLANPSYTRYARGLLVDCAKNITAANLIAYPYDGTTFSYNVPCYNIAC